MVARNNVAHIIPMSITLKTKRKKYQEEKLIVCIICHAYRHLFVFMVQIYIFSVITRDERNLEKRKVEPYELSKNGISNSTVICLD